MVKRYTENEVLELSKILLNDGVISVPTDTVYGLCARINSVKAYNKLLDVKNRPLSKPFAIMCANIEQVKEIAVVDRKAELLINSFMPGPITLVLNVNKNMPEYINNGLKTVAVRMATSKTIKELIEAVKTPLFMSSANKSGCDTCKTIEEIEIACPNIDAILEGSILYGKASTIVDCTSDEIIILREGPITKEQLLDVLEK